MDPRLGAFEEFWPYYLSQHLNPVNRALHFVGTTFVLLGVLAALAVSPWWILASPFAGYSFAWVGHFYFEKNRPATFTYPLWSLLADFRMYALLWRGRLGPEIRRAQELFPARAQGGL
jgi:hypothetical protein